MVQTVFLSASVPDPKGDPEYAATADAVAITAAVGALVYVTLGRRLLVWGGHPAITPMIWVVAKEFQVDYGAWVKLYQSRFFEDEFPDENRRFQNVTFTESVPGSREKSLEAMRLRMFTEHKFDAAIFVGGMGGVIEEFDMFRQLQPKALTVPIMSTGGAVRALVDRFPFIDSDLFDDMDYVMLLHRKLGIDVGEKRFRRPEEQPTLVSERLWHRPRS
jgi:hypothetical protein